MDVSGHLARSVGSEPAAPGRDVFLTLDAKLQQAAYEAMEDLTGRAPWNGAKIGIYTPAEKLHRLRLDCKKLRYLLTFFQSLYPPDTLKPLIKELKRLQDHLGDFNDLQIQQQALRGFAEEMMATKVAPPATLLAMGQLMGQLEGKQRKEREAFHDHFSRFSHAKNLQHFQELIGHAPPADAKNPDGGKGK